MRILIGRRRPKALVITAAKRPSVRQRLNLPPFVALLPIVIVGTYLATAVVTQIAALPFWKYAVGGLLLVSMLLFPVSMGLHALRRRRLLNQNVVAVTKPVPWFIGSALGGPAVLAYAWVLLRHDAPWLRHWLYLGASVLLLSTPLLVALFAYQHRPNPGRGLRAVPQPAWAALAVAAVLYVGIGMFSLAFTGDSTANEQGAPSVSVQVETPTSPVSPTPSDVASAPNEESSPPDSDEDGANVAMAVIAMGIATWFVFFRKR